MTSSPMNTSLNTRLTQSSDDVYTTFREADPLSQNGAYSDMAQTPKLRRWGFFGRMLEGTGIVAFSLAIAIATMTTGARAETSTMLSSATGDYASATMVAMIAVFAFMLVMLRKTWRQTGKTIKQAPRSSHRIS